MKTCFNCKNSLTDIPSPCSNCDGGYSKWEPIVINDKIKTLWYLISTLAIICEDTPNNIIDCLDGIILDGQVAGDVKEFGRTNNENL